MPAFLALNGGAAVAAVAGALALGLGARPSALLLAALAGYLIVVHSAVLAAGLTGHLTVSGLATVVAATAAVALWRLRRARRDGTGPRADGEAPRAGAMALVAPAAAVGSAVAWVWPHVVGATRLWVWDDYTYHMVYPTLWLREHAVAAVTPPQAFTMQAWYPLSGSLVAAWYMAPFFGSRGDALAWVSLTGVLYAGIVAAGAAELLARLGCRRGAWAVPLVLLATSRRIEIMASSFSDADLAVAAALFGAFVFAVPRGDGDAAAVTVDAGYAALLSGIALGVKVSAVPVAVIILGMVAWRAGGVRPASRVVALFAAAWAITGGYWYARNIVHTGNPVYPAAFLVWPGVTFPETTLLEYGRRYGLARTLGDALAVYANWPRAHAVLAAIGLLGLGGWLIVRWRAASTPRRVFGCATLVLTAVVLGLLPTAPYSAGNAMTFRSGFVHWDSMRYVALVPILGWTALGFLLDAGARWWRTVSPVVVAAVAVTTSVPAAVAALLAVVVAVALRSRPWPRMWHRGTRRGVGVAAGAIAALVAAFVVLVHGPKAAATRSALVAEPFFGAVVAELDRQPPGTRVAIFGDQWIYPAFGGRHDLRPVRLDRDGRVASAPIGDEMAPGPLTVDPSTFRANLRAAGIGVVVVVHQPHPGRAPDWPSQHTALQASPSARLLHRDRAAAVWQLGSDLHSYLFRAGAAGTSVSRR